jgi:hypothetical protein
MPTGQEGVRAALKSVLMAWIAHCLVTGDCVVYGTRHTSEPLNTVAHWMLSVCHQQAESGHADLNENMNIL